LNGLFVIILQLKVGAQANFNIADLPSGWLMHMVVPFPDCLGRANTTLPVLRFMATGRAYTNRPKA
jgi:hypothetical protein